MISSFTQSSSSFFNISKQLAASFVMLSLLNVSPTKYTDEEVFNLLVLTPSSADKAQRFRGTYRQHFQSEEKANQDYSAWHRFLLVCCLAYSSILKTEVVNSF
jgi:hypothetical protein